MKKYGNPYLGKDLWDKNYLFQCEKFEKQISSNNYFLDDKADAEFIEQLHVFQNQNTDTNSSYNAKKVDDTFYNSMSDVSLQAMNYGDESENESEKLLNNISSRSLVKSSEVNYFYRFSSY